MIRAFTYFLALLCLVAVCSQLGEIACEQIQLSVILPKLKAIHEDAQTLLIKNSELKAKILLGLQAQNEARLKLAKEGRIAGTAQKPVPKISSGTIKPTMTAGDTKEETIDYAELDEFNKWVDINLEYAVKNTQASMEALNEEAQTNNGNVDYSDQAIKDGIEGVKYWQSAVIFQDKTLKNEKFDIE